MPFSDVNERVAEIRGLIADAAARGGHGQAVRIVAVTKTHGPDAVDAAWRAGLLDVGENKVQEALDKQDAAERRSARGPARLRWHLIGHLQRNKVKFLGRFELLHALDSSTLADAVHEFGERSGPAGRRAPAGERRGRGNEGRVRSVATWRWRRSGCARWAACA